MALYDKLNSSYQHWIEDAWELSENIDAGTYYQSISWMALIYCALKRAPREVWDAFAQNIRGGVTMSDFLDFLSDTIKLQPEGKTPFEGKDSEFDAPAIAWLKDIQQAVKKAGERWKDDPDAWLLLFENGAEKVLSDINDFFFSEKVIRDLEKLIIDTTQLQIFRDDGEIDSQRFSKGALKVLQMAAERAAQNAMDYILPTHILLAVLYSDHSTIEKTIRKNLPPRFTLIGLKEFIADTVPLRQEHSKAHPLHQDSFSQFSLMKLTDARDLMAQNSRSEITLLDLFAGLLMKDRERDGGKLCNLFDNNDINAEGIIAEIRRLLADPVDDLPLDIPSLLAGRDLSWEASKGKIIPQKGFDDLKQPVMSVLYKKKRNSVVVLGNSGIGRTTFLEQLALKMSDKSLVDLPNKKLILLDCARISPQGKKTFLNDALQFAYGKKDIILCLDGLESIFIGENPEDNISSQFLEQFQYTLQKIDIQFLVTITPGQYHASFRQDFRLHKLFETFEQQPPSPALTREILQKCIPEWNETYGMKISEGAIEKAVQLTEQYMLSEYFPQKAINVVEEAADSKTLDKELQETEIVIGPENIVEVIAKLTGVPAEILHGNTSDIDYETPLEKRVVGQPEAVKTCAQELALIKSGMKDPEKPASVMLFAGMTGTGKTEMAKTLANLYSATKRLVTFTMGNFTEAHSISGIIGVPPGYVGSELGGPLINDINKDPYCVVLLDEIEKAHPDIWKPFLNLFDEGWIVDKRNTRANANRSIFVLTSNIGSDIASELYAEGASYETIRQAVKKALYAAKHPQTHMPIFSAEFLARIQKIVVFRPLDKEALKNILLLQISKKQEVFSRMRNKILDIKPAVIELLATECYHRYLESEGKEGGRVVHKLIIEYIDDIIQRCPSNVFKQATALEINGQSLDELKLNTRTEKISRKTALAAISQLLKTSPGELEMRVSEVIYRFNETSKLYKEVLGEDTPKISGLDKEAILDTYQKMLKKIQKNLIK